jgi:hypothetical protein
MPIILVWEFTKRPCKEKSYTWNIEEIFIDHPFCKATADDVYCSTIRNLVSIFCFAFSLEKRVD